ncbi:hypothetical protein CV103_17965 [Sphingomonas fennica]|uniref:Uncharacterized protein n=2 Tax=Edaphosphingomonas TaxID=3423724 RepID=A0A2T4HNM0_9SPHN|nr:hypothetical protein CV103_17965 [Sphingomonas fennica]
MQEHEMGESRKPASAEEELIEERVEAERAAIRRRTGAGAVDGGEASHEGGAGAQGGATDFGNPRR